MSKYSDILAMVGALDQRINALMDEIEKDKQDIQSEIDSLSQALSSAYHALDLLLHNIHNGFDAVKRAQEVHGDIKNKYGGLINAGSKRFYDLSHGQSKDLGNVREIHTKAD